MTTYYIELQPLPNQQFTTTINNINLTVDLKVAGNDDIMLFALQINDEYVCPYVPVFANQGLLPYKYMVSEVGGNFFFETEEDEYPLYSNFGTTCKLYFITEDELNG